MTTNFSLDGIYTWDNDSSYLTDGDGNEVELFSSNGTTYVVDNETRQLYCKGNFDRCVKRI